MTDQSDLPEAATAAPSAPVPMPEPVPEPAPAPPPTVAAPPPHEAAVQPRGGRSVLPTLTALGFALMVLGLGFEWSTVQDLQTQVASLAQQPTPIPVPSVDPARVAALEGRFTALEAKLAALPRPVASPAVAPAPTVSLAPLESRLAALEARKPDESGVADAKDAVAALDKRVSAVEAQQAALADKALRVLGYERAQLALEVGEPLGDLPGAPPALARFAHAKPPTEAALRLAFPAAAEAAEAASRPSGAGLAVAERMWLKIRALVTVKEGDTVLVGPPSAAVLSAAHASLEAGDLPGAVAALNGLDKAAGAAMANWRASAQALLDARAALAMAARG